MSSFYSLEVKGDDKDNLYIEFPDKLLQDLNWRTGDKINWIDNGDGSFTLKKLDNES